jgi:hypothetical protein
LPVIHDNNHPSCTTLDTLDDRRTCVQTRISIIHHFCNTACFQKYHAAVAKQAILREKLTNLGGVELQCRHPSYAGKQLPVHPNVASTVNGFEVKQFVEQAN